MRSFACLAVTLALVLTAAGCAVSSGDEKGETQNPPGAATTGSTTDPVAAGVSDEDGCPGGEEEDCDPASPMFPSPGNGPYVR